MSRRRRPKIYIPAGSPYIRIVRGRHRRSSPRGPATRTCSTIAWFLIPALLIVILIWEPSLIFVVLGVVALYQL